MMDKIYK